MVPSFSQLDLPQPSYGFIKTLQDFYEMHLCTKFYNGVIPKILACIIMLGFCKPDHICYMVTLRDTLFIEKCAKNCNHNSICTNRSPKH